MQVSFARNFGGRSSATQFASVQVLSASGRVLHTIVDPAEFRIRENGTVTIYSRRHRSTSVYGISTGALRTFVGIARHDSTIHALTF